MTGCSRVRLIQPQWSPLRRSGTTRARRRCTQVRGMSRNGARSGGAGRRGCTACCASVTCAAMEPAPEERDDSAGRCACGSPCTGRNGARSGGAGRLPLIINDAFDQAVAAAMEPAPGGAGRPAAVQQRVGAVVLAAREPAPEERDDRLRSVLRVERQRAAMEPAPEERNDRAAWTSAGSGSSGRNGARSGGAGRPPRTGRRVPAADQAAMEPAPEERDDPGRSTSPPARCRPHWSPLREERDDYSTLINIFQVWLAAMEPAPEERDDRLRGVIRVQRDTGAAMEPAPEERDDLGVACRNFAPLTAAMEPAPEERDDFGSQAVPGYDRPAAMEPAPEERDDLAGGLRRYSAMLSPQWSPLRRSGTTGPFNGYVWFVIKPQWSPLRRSGTTHVQRRQHEAVIAAAMEPAPEERDDVGPRCPATRSRRPRRNGARSGGAGRLAICPRLPTPVVLAAMEPAPEERDDRRSAGTGTGRGAPHPLRRSGTTCPAISGQQLDAGEPQWSPLRRSGTTDSFTWTGGAARTAAMEPAPEERDDVVRHRAGSVVFAVAAMEPAPEERDDVRSGIAS